jgi:hypothetical protein
VLTHLGGPAVHLSGASVFPTFFTAISVTEARETEDSQLKVNEKTKRAAINTNVLLCILPPTVQCG